MAIAMGITPYTSAWADFPQDAARLAVESKRLADEAVAMAEPPYISNAARSLDLESDRLAHCASIYVGAPSSSDPAALPGCRWEFGNAIRAYRSFEDQARGHVFSTRVYYQLERVRVAIRPFAGYYVSAVGRLNGWGFQFSGYDQSAIYSQCVNFAYSYGIRLVSEVLVNGYWFSAPWGRAWYVPDACRIVASRAY